MRKYKPYFIYILLVGLLLTMGCSIPDLGWVYELPNGYQIVMSGQYIRLTSDETVMYINKFNGTIIPDRQHIRMAVNGQYVGLIMVKQSDFKPYSQGADVEMFLYIVDEQEEVIYGPYYSEDEFEAELNKLNVPELGPWRELGTIKRVESYITQFCYNDQFVCVIRMYSKTIDDEELAITEWYILDGEIDVVYGPYNSEQEYEEALKELNVTSLNDWISTDKKPEGALL